MPSGRRRYVVQSRQDARSLWGEGLKLPKFIRTDAAILHAKRASISVPSHELRVFDEAGQCEVWHSRQNGKE